MHRTALGTAGRGASQAISLAACFLPQGDEALPQARPAAPGIEGDARASRWRPAAPWQQMVVETGTAGAHRALKPFLHLAPFLDSTLRPSWTAFALHLGQSQPPLQRIHTPLPATHGGLTPAKTTRPAHKQALW